MMESLMLDRTVTSQSRSESLIFRGPPATTTLLSSNDGNTSSAVGTKDNDDAEAREGPACTRRRVSMTLSQYLASDFSLSSVPPGDYGWFTPCASGPLIERITSSPRPIRYKKRRLTVSNADGSTNITTSLSPSSLVGKTASRGAILHKGSSLSLYTRGVTGVIPEEGQLSPAGTGGAASAAIRTLSTAEKFGGLYERLQSQHEATVGAGSSVRSRIASRGAGASSSIDGVPAGYSLQGAVFPIERRTTNRIAEINQWHNQHRHVSCSGRMDAPSRCKGSGRICTMHARRSFFAISKRYFSDKPDQSQVMDTIRLKEGDAGVGLRKSTSRSYAWALTEIRVISGGAPWDPARAEYLVVASRGRRTLVAGWRRASHFKTLADVVRRDSMSKACEAWETLERARRLDGGGPCNFPMVMRPRRLDTAYLHNKARFLEHFLEQFVLELTSDDALVTFLDTSLPYTVEI